VTAHTPSCGYCCGVPEELEAENNRLRAELANEKATADLIEAANGKFAEQNDRLRGELAELDQRLRAEREQSLRTIHSTEALYAKWFTRGREAEAAIGRVRSVCANPPVPSRMLIPYVRAAIEGNQP
jgi:hypothetical protein